jgi:hydroxypyruvate isomerase
MAFTGDPASLFAEVADWVGHVQIADFPGRHEPGTGTTDFSIFFRSLWDAGYRGAVGLEYYPSSDEAASFAWLPRELRSGSSAADLWRACLRT